MQKKGHHGHHHHHHDSTQPKLGTLTLRTNHNSDPDRPRPIIDGINNIGRALSEAGERRQEEKRREQKEHDKLVADAAKAKVYEDQRRARDLNRLANDLLQPFADAAAEERRRHEAIQRQRELDAAIARDRILQAEREAAERLRQDNIRLREAEIDKIQQTSIAEFERLKSAGLKLASAGNFSEALIKIDEAISEMQRSKTVWVNFQREMRINNPEKYRYTDTALAAIAGERKGIETKQRDALLKQEWENSRESVHLECKSLLLAQPAGPGLPGYIDKLNSYQAKFAKQRQNFDWYYKDSGMEKQLLDKITESNQLYTKYQAEQRLANIKMQDNRTQIRINECLVLARKDLDANNLRAAAANLSKACELVGNISDPNNIEPANNYVSYEILNSSLQSVKHEVEEAYLRAQDYVPKITQFVVDKALIQIDAVRGELCLYTDHLIKLKGNINTSLSANWHKFDSREFPQSFLDRLVNLIKSNVKTIGWTRYFEDWSKTKSVESRYHPTTRKKEFPLLDQHIQAEIDGYVPVTASPVFVSVPVFPDRVKVATEQLFNETILQAEVVHENQEVGASFGTVVPAPMPSAPPMKPEFH